MNKFIKQHKEIWEENPSELLSKYNYNKELTKELDGLHPQNLSKEILFKIVLWKLNRYPYISDDLIKDLQAISDMENHCDARETIGKLLKTPGIRLPMASAILRFLKPDVFQIIDDRAYRALLPGEPKYPTKPPKKITDKYINKYIDKSIDIYFKYLEKIHEISKSNPKFPFKYADRILYQSDIERENKIGD